MSDEPSDEAKKPKGLDLSKLLKKQPTAAFPASNPPAVSAVSVVIETEAEPTPTPQTEAKPPAAGGLAALMAKAKAKANRPEPEPVEEPEPVPERIEEPPPPPPKPVAKPPVAKTPPPKPKAVDLPSFVKSAQPKKPTPPPEAVAETKVAHTETVNVGRVSADSAGIDTSVQASRFVATVDDTASQQAVKHVRFDYTVEEGRQYPRGAFGVDELFTHAMDWTNTCRRNAWRIPKRYRDGFFVHLEAYGTVTYKATIAWDGKDYTLIPGEHVGEPAAYCRAQADAGIDLVRGRLKCAIIGNIRVARSAGDMQLLFAIGLRRPPEDPDVREQQLENAEREFNRLKKMRQDAPDAIGYFCDYLEHECAFSAARIEEPLFVRLTFETSPKVEVLIHAEAGKVRALRGKPGEELLQGAAELTVAESAIRPFFDGETSLFFLCRAGLIGVSGDLNVLPQLGLVPTDGVKILQTMAKTKALVSADNLYYAPQDTKVRYDPLGEIEEW